MPHSKESLVSALNTFQQFKGKGLGHASLFAYKSPNASKLAPKSISLYKMVSSITNFRTLAAIPHAGHEPYYNIGKH